MHARVGNTCIYLKPGNTVRGGGLNSLGNRVWLIGFVQPGNSVRGTVIPMELGPGGGGGGGGGNRKLGRTVYPMTPAQPVSSLICNTILATRDFTVDGQSVAMITAVKLEEVLQYASFEGNFHLG